jgi:endonuclease/exonuclease/phosphatase family metal-dependent hydrolase
MRRLSGFNKLAFFANIVLAILTAIAYVLPFLAPKLYPIFAVLTLFMPLFLILNGLFFLYWLLQIKRQMLLSGMILLIGITFVTKFYKFSSTNLPKTENDFVVMSYNVRLFNLFDWLADQDVSHTIVQFINEKNPDILCIQEYSTAAKVDLKVYPYHYIFMQGHHIKTGQAIFSKFPIIEQGNLELPANSNNNVIFADIKRGKEILRVYNMHLQSIKISPDVNEISENIDVINQQKSQLLLNRISNAFRQQQQQAEIIHQHKLNCEYPILICGDMNNSPFSYVYRNIRGNLQDCFEEAGKGFGQTYKFKYYPARIDYIFADPSLKVKSFESFPGFINSDHFPVMTRLAFE